MITINKKKQDRREIVGYYNLNLKEILLRDVVNGNSMYRVSSRGRVQCSKITFESLQVDREFAPIYDDDEIVIKPGE